jgi:hypothetical protein
MTPRIVGSMLAIVLLGCGDSRSASEDADAFADAVCGAADACGCAFGPAMGDDCGTVHADAFMAAHEGGLRVDRDCFDDFLAALERDPCLADADWATAREECFAMTDDRALGEECSTHPELASMRVDACDGDLVCTNGACAEPVDVVTAMEGDPCTPEPPDVNCGPGLYCSLDHTCKRHRADGAACESAWACFGPSYCPEAAPDDGSVCRPAADLGDSCEPAEFHHCGHEQMGGTTVSRWCDPSTRECAAGQSFLCDALLDPVNW